MAKEFVNQVIVDLVHSLTSPVPLAQVVLKSGQSHHLCEGVSQYLRSFLPSQVNTTMFKLPMLLCTALKVFV